jgi:hypothetical protein
MIAAAVCAREMLEILYSAAVPLVEKAEVLRWWILVGRVVRRGHESVVDL